MTTTTKNKLPTNLMSNLQDVLNKKKGADSDDPSPSAAAPGASESIPDEDSNKPIVLVTNGDGIDSPGLVLLVEALVREGLYNVHAIAPQSDKSFSGHSVTLNESVAVSSVDVSGAKAYEVSGTPVDCVSLAFSGALFSWSKPLLVISGINRGSSCGHHMFYSGVVAGAREALINGVPSISISLNWKGDASQESNFNDAVAVCMPIINAAVRDIEKGAFPKSCSLNIEIPTSPSTNKGFRVTKQSSWHSSSSWRAVSCHRNPAAGNFMSNQQSIGIQLAQLGKDASAAAAARRQNTKKVNVEIESVGAAEKSGPERVKKYFRQEFHPKDVEDTDEDFDIKALEDGFVAVTPVWLPSHPGSDTQTEVEEWIATVLKVDN